MAVVFEAPEDGGYVARVPAVPGVAGQGEVLRLLLEYLEEEGFDLPEDIPPEGRFREIEVAA